MSNVKKIKIRSIFIIYNILYLFIYLFIYFRRRAKTANDEDETGAKKLITLSVI